MAEPPPYEESASCQSRRIFVDQSQADLKLPQRFSIREEVETSRSQHVAAIVAKLVPRVRERAQGGLSKSTMLLFPSSQDCTRKGQLVGFGEDDTPILVQLEGRQDHLEFWTQQTALATLHDQLLAAISEDMPTPEPLETLLLEEPHPGFRSSWFGRKQSKLPSLGPIMKMPAKVPVTVEVHLDEVHFRSETEYGLYQTLKGRCVWVAVEVR